MKALSVKQPWAWLIIHGYKDIENRNWPTGFRGRVYIHAGKKADWESLPEIERIMCGNNIPHDIVVINNHLFSPPNDFLSQLIGPIAKREPNSAWASGIIGEVDITGCVTESRSPWFVGKYGFTLSQPISYLRPIPYRGQLGFFEVPDFEVKRIMTDCQEGK